MDFTNKNLTFAGIGILVLALAWFLFFGANTSYLRGALINDLDCGSVDGFETIFTRESIDPSTTIFAAENANFSLDELFAEGSNQEIQVRIYNDSQSCDQQTIVKCDFTEVIPYENSNIYICRDIKDDNSSYLLDGGNMNDISDFAYYLQDINSDSRNKFFDDAVYTRENNQMDLNLVDITNYKVLIQQR
ncbi:hypothetical protein HOJ01_02690 [bacterium]|jgi:hypothetical protein|nr:hypothetical protein [bacterium]MBT6293692.1 hypothetical protein [bacterium]